MRKTIRARGCWLMLAITAAVAIAQAGGCGGDAQDEPESPIAIEEAAEAELGCGEGTKRGESEATCKFYSYADDLGLAKSYACNEAKDAVICTFDGECAWAEDYPPNYAPQCESFLGREPACARPTAKIPTVGLSATYPIPAGSKMCSPGTVTEKIERQLEREGFCYEQIKNDLILNLSLVVGCIGQTTTAKRTVECCIADPDATSSSSTSSSSGEGGASSSSGGGASSSSGEGGAGGSSASSTSGSGAGLSASDF